MRRPWWSRLAAAVLGIWLVLVLGEPGVVHVCPTHDGAGAAMAMQHGAHAMGAGHVAGHQHDAPGHEPKGCSCVGCCVTVGAVALLAQAPTIAAARVAVPTAVERAQVELLPRPGPRYRRPYTTGPPRA